jgi:hypothetical protein
LAITLEGSKVLRLIAYDIKHTVVILSPVKYAGNWISVGKEGRIGTALYPENVWERGEGESRYSYSILNSI